MAEYKTNQQSNINWGESFNMAVKAPAVANRIFLTYSDAFEYVNNVYGSSTEGLRLSVLTNYVKDAEPSYTSGHFAYVNGEWVTAQGLSSGDTYTLGNGLSGLYYIRSIGDGENNGELVKLAELDDIDNIEKYATKSAAETAAANLDEGTIVIVYNDGNNNGVYYVTSTHQLVAITGSQPSDEIKKYPTKTAAESDMANLSDGDVVVVYGGDDKGVYYVSKPQGETPSLVLIGSVEDPEIRTFQTLAAATTFASTAADGIIVSVTSDSTADNNGIYYTANHSLVRLGEMVDTSFSTKSAADTFAATAELGTIVSVYGDSTESNNGVYYVAEGDNDTQVLIKVGAEVIKNAISVSGVNIGSYNNGDTIQAGTSFEEILRNILSKAIDVETTAPKATASVTGAPSNIQEVGTAVSFTLGMTYTDGNYSSSDTTLYSNAKFDELNGTTGGSKNAGCTEGAKTYKLGSTTLNDPAVSINVAQQTYNYTGSIAYGASTQTAKMSNNQVSSKSISAGNANVSLCSFTGKYKYYYGYTAYIPGDDYSSVFKSQSDLGSLTGKFLENSGSTLAGNNGVMTSSANQSSLVLVLPASATITKTQTSNDIDVDVSVWVYQNDITYTNGSATTTYKVYVLSRQNEITYKRITIN